MRDLAGTAAVSTDIGAIEREVKQAILDFEPRILPDTLSVRVVLDEESVSQKCLSFHIEGQLWAQPMPVSMLLSTEIDLDTGVTSIKESSG